MPSEQKPIHDRYKRVATGLGSGVATAGKTGWLREGTIPIASKLPIPVWGLALRVVLVPRLGSATHV